jgi:RNA-directed DNA polymerase
VDSILSINKLASILGVNRQLLEDIANEKSKHYHPFTKEEVKKDGTIKVRRIDNPSTSIKSIQRKINKKLIQPKCNDLPKYMTGSIKGRGIKHNAQPHVASEAVLCADISDCFPSISSSKIYKVFKEQFGCSPPVAKLLAKLTAYGDRLPQGAPTSSGLCNLVLLELSAELHKLSEDRGLALTQYIDDLTFSGTKEALIEAKPIILALIKSHGFKVNERKLKLETNKARMEVTGLVVNNKVSVGRKYVREIERDILDRREPTSIKGKIAHVGSVNLGIARRLSKKLKTRS